MKSDAQREAEARYARKCKTLHVKLYPGTDADIIEHVGSMKTYNKYIKRLIRSDMQK